MSFLQKGHRKDLKGDSDVTRENVYLKDRGELSSEVAESAAKESTPYSPLLCSPFLRPPTFTTALPDTYSFLFSTNRVLISDLFHRF